MLAYVGWVHPPADLAGQSGLATGQQCCSASSTDPRPPLSGSGLTQAGRRGYLGLICQRVLFITTPALMKHATTIFVSFDLKQRMLLHWHSQQELGSGQPPDDVRQTEAYDDADTPRPCPGQVDRLVTRLQDVVYSLNQQVEDMQVRRDINDVSSTSMIVEVVGPCASPQPIPRSLMHAGRMPA